MPRIVVVVKLILSACCAKEEWESIVVKAMYYQIIFWWCCVCDSPHGTSIIHRCVNAAYVLEYAHLRVTEASRLHGADYDAVGPV